MASTGASRDGKGRGRKRQVTVNENSPVIKAFRGYQLELDTKHDRYERIVKLSRDITIESKRVIFLLQRCAGDDTKGKETVLQEAQAKLKEVQKTKFLQVALELEGLDHYQYIRAYSPGLQEYIEAVSFYHYLKDGQLVTLSEVEKDLKFSKPSTTSSAQDAQPAATTATTEFESPGTAVSSSSSSSHSTATAPNVDSKAEKGSNQLDPVAEVSSTSDSIATVDVKDKNTDDTVLVTVPPMEFMLGIADLTGELMRTAIMSVSAGNLDYPVQICEFMRIIHDAFVSYGNTARELNRKMATLRQSLQKVENACYTLKVRGSEIPKHMLADIFTTTSAEGPFAEDRDDSNYEQ